MRAPLFDLELTLNCGQVFHWRREVQGDGWAGMIGGARVWVRQKGEELEWKGVDEGTIRRYFALDHPLEEIYATFPDDPAMAAALAQCRGLRIIRQPAWECLATFITSSLKQVSHIAQISHALRQAFGEGHAYPLPERIAALDEAELRACKLGYRARGLRLSAIAVASGEVDLEAVARMDDDAALSELCRLHGVGSKIANCVLLFAYERLRAFPIDVWIERVLREIYFVRKRNVTPERLRKFSAEYFGPYGGYAQQYLFHHARTTWRERHSALAAR